MDETNVDLETKELLVSRDETIAQSVALVENGEKEVVNRNKPWREIIRRNVIDGGGNN